MVQNILLKLKNITKIFPGVMALKEVDLNIYNNEIIGIVGENGAGKTTLMKVLIGLYQPDKGDILLNNKKVKFSNPRDASKQGIGMVFQEQSLLPNLTVTENIFLGQEEKFVKNGFLSLRHMAKEAKTQLKKIDPKLNINPKSLIRDLTYAEKQMVEMARLFWLDFICNIDNPVLILDEPTTVLSQVEIKTLFDNLKKLKDKSTIIFISHRLEEVIKISDRIIIMKDGEVVSNLEKKEFDVNGIYKLMVGREISDEYYKENKQIEPKQKVVLEVKNLDKKGSFKKINFNLMEGEIISLVGLFGSGKEELARCIAGIIKPDNGNIFIDNIKLKLGSSMNAINNGIGYLPADRRDEGVALQLDVKTNITSAIIRNLGKFGWLNLSKESKLASYWRDILKISTPSLATLVVFLSGGNQQKVVLSKWLAAKSKLLIMDHPTRGVDVGAKEEVYSIIRQLTSQGISIILMSDTLEEDIALSNRLLVMLDGEMVKEIKSKAGEKPKPFEIIEYMG